MQRISGVKWDKKTGRMLDVDSKGYLSARGAKANGRLLQIDMPVIAARCRSLPLCLHLRLNTILEFHGTNQVACSPFSSQSKRALRFPNTCKTSQSIESIRQSMAIKFRRFFSVSSRLGAFLSKKSGRPDDGLSTGVPGGSTAQ